MHACWCKQLVLQHVALACITCRLLHCHQLADTCSLSLHVSPVLCCPCSKTAFSVCKTWTWVTRPGCLGCAKCHPDFICSISMVLRHELGLKYQHYTADAGRWRWAFRLVRHLTGSSTHFLDPHWTDAERCSLSSLFSPCSILLLTLAFWPSQVMHILYNSCVRHKKSILFIGDQTRSWSRAWWHAQDSQQLGSLLYYIDVLLAYISSHDFILK